MTIEATSLVHRLAETNPQIPSAELFILHAVAEYTSSDGELHWLTAGRQSIQRFTHLPLKTIDEVLWKLHANPQVLRVVKDERHPRFDLEVIKAYIDSKDYPA